MQKPLQNCIFSSCNLSLVWCFQRAETDSKWSKTMKSLRKTKKTRFFHIKKYFFFDKTKKCKILHPHCMHYFRFVEKKHDFKSTQKVILTKNKKSSWFCALFCKFSRSKRFRFVEKKSSYVWLRQRKDNFSHFFSKHFIEFCRFFNFSVLRLHEIFQNCSNIEISEISGLPLQCFISHWKSSLKHQKSRRKCDWYS